MSKALEYSYGTSISLSTWMEQVVNNMPTRLCLCLSTKPYVLDHDLGVIMYVFCWQVLLQFKMYYFKSQYTYLHSGTNNVNMDEIIC